MNWFKRKIVEIAEEAIERWANTKFPEWFSEHKELIFEYLEKEVDDFEAILVLKWADGVPPVKEAVQDVIDTMKYVFLHGRLKREEEVAEEWIGEVSSNTVTVNTDDTEYEVHN